MDGLNSIGGILGNGGIFRKKDNPKVTLAFADGDCTCEDCGKVFTGKITHKRFVDKENQLQHTISPVRYCPACIHKGAEAYDLKRKQAEAEEKKKRVEAHHEFLIRLSKLPPFTENKYRFDNYLKRNISTTEALAAVQRFIGPDRQHHFLTIACKTKGVGKTHLLVAAAWAWLKPEWKPVIYYETSADLLDDLKASFHTTDPEEKDQLDIKMNLLKTVSLLVIDDLGVEKVTDWTQERFDIIINHRYFNALPTLIATNLEDKEIEQRIGSRILEGEVVEINNTTDFRPEIARMRQNEMKKIGGKHV